MFDFAPCVQGRLSRVRRLYLNITVDRNNAFGSFGSIANRAPSREDICRDWVNFLMDEPGAYQYITLPPSLHTLVLDFYDWKLGTEEGLFVSFA